MRPRERLGFGLARGRSFPCPRRETDMTGSTPQPISVDPGEPGGYTLRISPTTVDKLGVKLYDKVSAVVAELLANAYDADAEKVLVNLPLGTHLAVRDKDTKL